MAHARHGRGAERAVQLVQFEVGSNRPWFSLEELRSVTSSAAIRDLPTLAISIGGVARSGKSFMLNLFINYLTYVEEHGTDVGWKKSESFVSGVNWAKSKTAVTLGIWMWNRPFILTGQDGQQVGYVPLNGMYLAAKMFILNSKLLQGRIHKVAVLLIDSQGTGDNRRSDVKLDTLITLISLQISTVQIININMYLRLDELTSLQLCTDYSEVDGGSTKSLFQSLIFLIRNEQSSDPGEDPNILEEIIEDGDNEIPVKAATGIKKAFKDVTAFNFPYPGNRIAKASEDEDPMRIREIPDDFLEPVFALCKRLFDLKRISQNFQLERGDEFTRQFELLKSRYESELLPDVQSPSDALQESLIWNSYREMLKAYDVYMGDIIERLDTLNSLAAFEDEIDAVVMLANSIIDGDTDRFGKSKIWRKYKTMLDEKSGDDFVRLSAKVQSQVDMRLLESERTARMLLMEDETEIQADTIRLYQEHLNEAQEEMRNIELRNQQRDEEFREEMTRLQNEAAQARLAERRRLQTMIAEKERQREQIAEQRQREEKEQRQLINQLNEKCRQLRNKL